VLVERLRRIAEVAQARADLAFALRSMIWNIDLVEALELNNLIGQAAVSLNSTVYRTEIRGTNTPVDLMEIAAAIPTTPPTHQPQHP
jgi:succinate dehydrogenase / fumarate reductase flavoprotein subunit